MPSMIRAARFFTCPSEPAPRRTRGFQILPALLLLVAMTVWGAPVGVAAQESEDGAAQEAGASADDGALRSLTPEDFGQWESLGSTDLSPDGSWLSVQVRRVNEEGELRIRPVANPDSLIVVPHGNGATFSEDGRWLAWSVGVGPDEAEERRERGDPVRQDLELMDLRNGTTTTVKEVSSFSFSDDGSFLAMRRYAPSGEREHDGVDVVVRDLNTDVDVNFGNVSELAWQDEGPLLAMVIDAAGSAGNGVRIWEPSSGTLRVLETDQARYSGLTWREDANDLAVLKALTSENQTEGTDEADEAWADTAHVAVVFRGLQPGGGEVRSHTLDPERGMPDDHRVVPWEDLRWSEDGSMLFVGIQERTPLDPCEAGSGRSGGGGDAPGEGGGEDDPQPEGDAEGDATGEEADAGDDGAACPDEDEDDPTVEIWHAADVDIVPTQKVRSQQERRENDLVAWHVDRGDLVRLEDELTENVTLVEDASFAIGRDDTPWETERMFGPVYSDIYLVDLETGEKEQVLERMQYFFGASPGAEYLLFLEDDQYRTYDVQSGDVTCITCDLPTSFVDLEDDHTVQQKPPFYFAGWLEDDEAVLIYDKHDVWRVDPAGGGGERVTWGAEDNVRHRLVNLDPDQDAIDPDAPAVFSLYDDWQEMTGYGRADRLGDEVERLSWAEARVYGLQKADDADVFSWRVESFEDSPDVFVGNADLSGNQITRTNPFQGDYLWGRAELVEYVNEWGDTLQGSLYYPAGYQPGQQYPMITYIYEIRSNAVRSYQVPSERNYYNMQRWVQDGYFVFQPDIVYRDRNPGLSAVANIEPAVEEVLATGMVDPERVGLIGHSWGGYQTTFFVTQSDLFAAGVAGAPLTNLFSMYLSVYWNSGSTDARIFEISQGRMEVPFWEDEESYRANSPVFHIENMETPLLMAQGTEDGAVDFNQGVEFYNAARRAGKDFVFLVYNGENHGLAQEANQLDYHRRINEWFGHYLKGEEAPEWMTEGVPYLEQPTAQAGGR